MIRMGFDLSAFLALLPDFIIAGILSLLFFLEIRNIAIKRKEKPAFILVREDNRLGEQGSNNLAYTELNSSDNGHFLPAIRNVQMAMLAVNIWILLTLILLPSSSISRLLPVFSREEQYIVYSALGVVFVTAILSTVILRISNTWPRIVTTLGIVGVGIFIIFYIPSMQWISTYSLFTRGIILYSIIVAALFLSYGFFTLPSGKIEKLSVAGTISSYAFTSAILFINLFQSLLI